MGCGEQCVLRRCLGGANDPGAGDRDRSARADEFQRRHPGKPHFGGGGGRLRKTAASVPAVRLSLVDSVGREQSSLIDCIRGVGGRWVHFRIKLGPEHLRIVQGPPSDMGDLAVVPP